MREEYLALTIDGEEIKDPTGFDEISIPDILSFFLTAFFVVGALTALIFMIIGGIRWISSGGDAEQLTRARLTIIFSLIGLGVILISVFVVNFVSDLLGFPFLELGNSQEVAPEFVPGERT